MIGILAFIVPSYLVIDFLLGKQHTRTMCVFFSHRIALGLFLLTLGG